MSNEVSVIVEQAMELRRIDRGLIVTSAESHENACKNFEVALDILIDEEWSPDKYYAAHAAKQAAAALLGVFVVLFGVVFIVRVAWLAAAWVLQ